MNSRYRGYMLSAVLGGLMIPVPELRAAQPALDAKAVDRLAVDARSSTEHLSVAKHYRERAKSLEDKASKLERAVREEKTRPQSAMETKWPAMIVNARERKVQIAMQSRRAAQEALALAQRHEKLAAQADASVASAESK